MHGGSIYTKLVMAIEAGTTMNASDGSLANNNMMHIWDFKHETGRYSKGYGSAPHRIVSSSSTRAEQGGRAAIFTNILEIIIKRHTIKPVFITICIDKIYAILKGSIAPPEIVQSTISRMTAV